MIRRTAAGWLATGLGLIAATHSFAAGICDDIAIRVHDAQGPPGGLIAVVLRTYESRPIDQGQVCLQVGPLAPGQQPPLASFEGAQVFGPDVDSSVTVTLGADPQTILLAFSSPTAAPNTIEGPLAVLYFRLDASVQPGQTYGLSIDLAGTSLTGGDGLPVGVDPRPGKLTIRAPGAPLAATANAEDTVPGANALLSLRTYEPAPLSLGRIGLHYDPTIAAGPPAVAIDPRHGQATVVVDDSTPGLVVVDFESVGGTLNEVPGDLIEVKLPTSPAVPVGTQSLVSLDPELTFLVDSQGQQLPLALGSDVLGFGELSGHPGVVDGLSLTRSPAGGLALAWQVDCGAAAEYSIYRGDLLQGYGSLAPEPGRCSVCGTSATVPYGDGAADFFLVVPHVDGLEGSYGVDSTGAHRPAAAAACNAQGSIDVCAP